MPKNCAKLAKMPKIAHKRQKTRDEGSAIDYKCPTLSHYFENFLLQKSLLNQPMLMLKAPIYRYHVICFNVTNKIKMKFEEKKKIAMYAFQLLSY